MKTRPDKQLAVDAREKEQRLSQNILMQQRRRHPTSALDGATIQVHTQPSQTLANARPNFHKNKIFLIKFCYTCIL
jgi:hypothetical protein